MMEISTMGMWAWCLEGEINDWVGIHRGGWWLQAFRGWIRIAGLTQSRPVYLRHTYIDIPVSLSLMFCSHRLYIKLEKSILARGTHRGGRVLIKGLMSMKCASLTLYKWLWWQCFCFLGVSLVISHLPPKATKQGMQTAQSFVLLF